MFVKENPDRKKKKKKMHNIILQHAICEKIELFTYSFIFLIWDGFERQLKEI